MNGSQIAAVIRAWVDLYTRGLPADVRAARRDEIDDDLWCDHTEATAAGLSARSLDADLALRLIFGMPSDISWRLAYHRAPDPAVLAKRASTNTRILGLVAIVGASAWGSLIILAGSIGDVFWTWGAATILLVGSMIAFAVAALGLASQFVEHVGRLGAVGALVVAFGSSLLAGASVVGLAVLPLGSAMLTWDLAGIGVLPRRASITHLAAVAILALALAGAALGQANSGLGLLGIVGYLLSWFAIGVSLWRGVARAQPTSG